MQKNTSRSRSPSRAYLPELADAPSTILEYLHRRFPHVGEDVWRTRLAEGSVHSDDCEPISPETPYRSGITLSYFREVAEEPQIPFEETIIFSNEHLLVADKPHFMPVTPSGPWVNECLLSRLRHRTGIEDLSPLHRLDMETAGLVLFSLRKETRGVYHRLFAEGNVLKEYAAVGSIERRADENEWMVENRLEAGEPWFRMKIVPGEPNAITRIILAERRDDRGLFRLYPRTGKKHQLRIHLASIGCPILNDQFYPDVLHAETALDYAKPLQLLALRLGFRDPVTGEEMEFESGRGLEW